MNNDGPNRLVAGGEKAPPGFARLDSRGRLSPRGHMLVGLLGNVQQHSYAGQRHEH
jgi:hypothetical protein